ncbi:nucleoid-associated protein, partial [Salmonella enterica subsp. enterica serovar Kentucky]|nr:nucleoid-associated protein [Salmonella enterica subsp. enterica serovar Kentucky]
PPAVPPVAHVTMSGTITVPQSCSINAGQVIEVRLPDIEGKDIFSRAATGRLRDELAKYPFADGGIVLFCHYRYLAVEYLLVTVL